MSDSKKYDSVLVGYVDEPRFDSEGNLISWTVKLKDHEVKDILDSYVTPRNEQGQGGNVIIKLFMSKNGKACASVYNPHSEAAKDRKVEKPAAKSSGKPAAKAAPIEQTDDDDLPF